MKLKKISRGLTTVFIAIFTLMLGLTALAVESEADINQILGTSSFEIKYEENLNEDTEYFKKKTSSIDEFMKNKLALIEELTDEGTVLLKNNDTLPLKTEKKITLFGKTSTSLVYGGNSGNATIGNAGNENVNMTLKKGLELAGFEINPQMWDFYKTQKNEPPVESLPTDGLAEYNEAAIVLISRVTGEGSDAADGYYELTDTELKLVKKAEEISEKVIVIINSPSPVAVSEWKKDERVDAILQIGGAGAMGAKSLGKILRGTVNPSGKLVDIYAADSRSSAAYQVAGTMSYANADAIKAAGDSTYGIGAGGTKYTVFQEGIYVGYKYYETRYEDSVLNRGNANGSAGVYKSENNSWNYADEVDYSFGYGLSYSAFTQEIVECNIKDNVVTVKVKVTNKGPEQGKDVVQLYVQSPYTEYDKNNGVEKSAIQLAGMAKTDILLKNASATVEIKVDLYSIASYDYKGAKTWILDNGDYYFAIGNGAHDALNNVLAAKKAVGVDTPGNAELAYKWTNTEFKNFSDYKFTDKGFTTENGLFHNDTKTVNRLEKADLNNLIGPETTVYLSRSDWQKTWPAKGAAVTATKDMIDDIAFIPSYEKGENVGNKHVYGADTGYNIMIAKGLSYDDEVWESILNQMTVDEMIATVDKNFGAIDPIYGLGFKGTNDNDGVGSGPNAFYLNIYDSGNTVIDGEKKYSSLNAKMYPSETVVAATFNQKKVYELGEMQSEDCYYVGLVTLWGPGLNIHRHPYSGRNFEYFSEDSMLTYILGAQLTAGLQSNGVIASPKHFAFNDQETDRYGYGVFTNEQAARENSLRGFEGAVAVAKTKNIMTALNRIGCDWMGASVEVQQNILRDEWGFDGYTITDNAAEGYMHGYAITAGTDKFMLLTGAKGGKGITKASVLEDEKMFKSVRQACHRILYVYVNSKAVNGLSASSYIVRKTPWWKLLLINIDVILGCVIALGVVGYIAGYDKDKKEVVEE